MYVVLAVYIDRQTAEAVVDFADVFEVNAGVFLSWEDSPEVARKGMEIANAELAAVEESDITDGNLEADLVLSIFYPLRLDMSRGGGP